MNIAFGARLNAQTAAMNSSSEFNVEALLNRLEKIHHEMMRDVVTAQRENVFVLGPFALHEFDIEVFIFKKTFFDRGENGRFAGQPDVADANFHRAGRSGSFGGCLRALLAA